jgi:hypothetical protein
MSNPSLVFDPGKIKVLPLGQRRSLCQIDDILIKPESAPKPLPALQAALTDQCAQLIRQARERKAGVMLIYGAHLLRNGAALMLEQMMAQGWITHLATNGAGSIHDWEYAFLGKSTESVRENVATGTFGTWDETGRNLHLALLAGGLQAEGYGRSVGKFIFEDGAQLPGPEELIQAIQSRPLDALAPARAELLQAMHQHQIRSGHHAVHHPWKHASILAQAYRHNVPLTVHPGIGYDIISTHPWFNGAAIGRAAALDFYRFASGVDALDGGVVLSIGTAIMGPQVFEKAMSCVNNVRLQSGRSVVRDHNIFVVDLQEGGNWDWTQGEPPKANPAYYLRFCKSYARMGGKLHYLQCDNATFVHQLCQRLSNAPHE